MFYTSISRKIPKTLSGIETGGLVRAAIGGVQRAGKYLKPYQGLKRFVCDDFDRTFFCAGKYLKPYQGLKRRF